jgi:6-phosphogluconolactonase (cycloisomerase 2 family)
MAGEVAKENVSGKQKRTTDVQSAAGGFRNDARTKPSRKARVWVLAVTKAESIHMATAKMSMGSEKDMGMSPHKSGMNGCGHLYIQTNETQNRVIHYRRAADGTITEVARSRTGGAGSGEFKPISGQLSAPNAFEGAGSVILAPDHKLLFVTNGGDNSVSSFSVGDDGRLTLVDREPTGNAVMGKSGTAKSLAFEPSKRMLYVLHSFGPDHLRLISVDAEGNLSERKEGYTVNTKDKADRVPTMAVLSPDGKFLLVGTTFDQPIAHTGMYPDGSPILWVPKSDGTYKVIASNAPDPDGLIVFPVQEDGMLGTASFQDAKAGSPFYLAFLHGQPDTLVIGYAVGDGCAMATIDPKGKLDVGPLVKIDTSPGLPSELCWLAISPDDKFVYATHFGYSYLSSYRINGDGLEVAKDPACQKVPGDGTARGLNTTVTSGPADSWVTPDGAFVYQIYGNAAKLIGYATHPDGSLTEVARVGIPYNSPVGLAGF